jgi:phosphopantothenoylcysteine decarboxylase/phosphopantothenate--cysteine ligase
MQLTNKHIVLGVTGSIAAYKAADLVRRLQETGAEVRVVMTPSATEFVTPLTFQAVSGNPVHMELLDSEAEAAMGHIQLARWADVVLIAPASANIIAKLAQGIADDLLTTLCVATSAPIAVAPAMNQQMWQDKATQNNIQTLRQRDVFIFGPGEGSQACGETGPGRMLEPEQITQLTAEIFTTGALAGKNVLITAGPTFEDIDPVRYIGNRSSGKMGFALATAAMEAGAKVTLISGPVHLDTPPRITRINVRTAQEMFAAVMEHTPQTNIFISTAAVADYRPKQTTTHKIKKSTEDLTLALTPNPDILATVANSDPGPFTIGFAAETNDIENYAKQKLTDKNLDMIAANQVGQEGRGFESDENALQVFWREGNCVLPQDRKEKLARHLLEIIAEHYRAQQKTNPVTKQQLA